MNSNCIRLLIDYLLCGQGLYKGLPGMMESCGGEIVEYKDVIRHEISHGLNGSEKVEADDLLPSILSMSRSPFEVIRKSFPADLVDVSKSGRIRDNYWPLWLDSGWGYDPDSLSLLAAYGAIHDQSAFLALARDLPTTQEPCGVESLDRELWDCHLHAGAIPAPTLIWVTMMEYGLSHLLGQDHDDHQAIATKKFQDENGLKWIKERQIALRRTAVVARMLLTALMDMASDLEQTGKGSNWRSPADCDIDERRQLYHIVKGKLRDEQSSDLNQFLSRCFGKLGLVQLTDFEGRGRLREGEPDSMAMLQYERSVVASMLWRTCSGIGCAWESEILLLYLRCKNFYLSNSSGNTENTGLTFFRESTMLGRVWSSRANSDQKKSIHSEVYGALARGVSADYRRSGRPSGVDVRLPRSSGKVVEEMVRWLQTALAGLQCRVLLSVRRDELRNGNVSMGEHFDFADTVRKLIENTGFEVLGVDLVGAERFFSLDGWVESILKFRGHVRHTFSGPGILVLHLGEDTNGAIEGLCSISVAIKKCGLGPGDRIAHALDLLAPDRRGRNRILHLNPVQSGDLNNALKDLVADEDIDPKVRQQIDTSRKNLFSEVDRSENQDLSSYPGALADVVADFVRDPIASALIKKGIALEICPTSNWRIGPLKSPMEHPVSWWVERGGKYFVGTDDPNVLPCTIATELFAVQRSLILHSG